MACRECVERHIAGAELAQAGRGGRGSVVWHLLRAAEKTGSKRMKRELERARIDYQRDGMEPDWNFLRRLADAED